MILELFKTKKNPPKLTTTLFDKKFIDFHSHILPGMDDGCKTMEDSLEILRKMRNLGIQHFVLTPHVMKDVWENSTENIISKFHELKEIIAQQEDLQDLSIRVAAEYMLDENFLQLLEKKDLLPIKDNMILVELSYLTPPINLFELIAEIQRQGYQPILAHPERYIQFHQNEGIYCKLKSAGCLFQVNLLSLTSSYSKEAFDAALWLLRNNLIDFVGSDIHREHQVEGIEEVMNRFGLVELLQPVLKNNYQLL